MGRLFTLDTELIDYGASAPLLYNSNAWTVLGWFKKNNGAGVNSFIFDQYAAFNIQVRVYLNDATAGGAITGISRTISDNMVLNSDTKGLADGKWHRFAFVRVGSSNHRLYVDGRFSGEELVTAPALNATASTDEYVGNNGQNETSSFGDGSPGTLARIAFWQSTALSLNEIEQFLFTGKSSVKPDLWHEYDDASLADKSGNGYNGTATGTSPVLDHPPVTGPFKDYSPPKFAFTEPPTDVRIVPNRRVWTKQPPAGTKIDLSHPLARGLSHVYLPGSSDQNHVDNIDALSDHVSVGREIDPAYGRVYMGTSSSVMASVSGKGFADTLGKTIAVVARTDNTTTNALAFVLTSKTGAVPPLVDIYTSTSSTINAGHRRAASGALQLVTGPAHNDEWFRAVYVTRTLTLSELYVEGDPTVYSGTNDVGASVTAADVAAIGAGYASGSPSNNFTGPVAIGVAWDGELTELEARLWLANPWQIFEPQIIYAPFPEELPKLAVIEPEVTRMPVRPPSE
jgi:hypothetical protein